MRRRLLRLLLLTLVLPVAAALAEEVADRLEASRGPSRSATILRHGSRMGQLYARRR